MRLKEYQKSLVEKAINIIHKQHMVYLAMETRTGKTPVSIMAASYIANELGNPSILFSTKKSAMKSIEKTFREMQTDIPELEHISLQIVSMDSMHKVDWQPNRVLIIDEAHGIGAYPKPSKRAISLAGLSRDCIVIYLSATPTPESYSQIYHQLWAARSKSGLIYGYKNFYAWARDYVVVKERRIAAGRVIKDYSAAKEKMIIPYLEQLTVSITQKDAGFKQTEPQEIIWDIEMPQEVKDLLEALKKHRVTVYNGHEILAATAATLLSKVMQICSGTVIPEGHDKGIVISTYKARALNLLLAMHKRIAVYYVYKAEREMLISVFGDLIIEDATEFDAGLGRIFISQFVSGREGINLRSTNCIVFFNIQHSYLSYAQTINRPQNINRTDPYKIVFLASKGGIEKKILKCVKGKRDYTLRYFKKDLGSIAADMS